MVGMPTAVEPSKAIPILICHTVSSPRRSALKIERVRSESVGAKVTEPRGGPQAESSATTVQHVPLPCHLGHAISEEIYNARSRQKSTPGGSVHGEWANFPWELEI